MRRFIEWLRCHITKTGAWFVACVLAATLVAAGSQPAVAATAPLARIEASCTEVNGLRFMQIDPTLVSGDEDTSFIAEVIPWAGGLDFPLPHGAVMGTYQVTKNQTKVVNLGSWVADDEYRGGGGLRFVVYTADTGRNHPLADATFEPWACQPVADFFSFECTALDQLTVTMAHYAPWVNVIWTTAGNETVWPMGNLEERNISPAPQTLEVAVLSGWDKNPVLQTETFETDGCNGPVITVHGKSKVTTSTATRKIRVHNYSTLGQFYWLSVKEKTAGRVMLEKRLTGYVPSGGYKEFSLKLPSGTYYAYASTTDEKYTQRVKFSVSKYAAPTYKITSKKRAHVNLRVNYPRQDVYYRYNLPGSSPWSSWKKKSSNVGPGVRSYNLKNPDSKGTTKYQIRVIPRSPTDKPVYVSFSLKQP